MNITEQDWKRWETENRIDLSTHPFIDQQNLTNDISLVKEMNYSAKEFKALLQRLNNKTGVQHLWGEHVTRCPFLKRITKNKYRRLIHKTKPQIYREFPFTKDGEVRPNGVHCPEVKLKK